MRFIHIAKYQERPGRLDFCGEDDFGGSVHRCIHSICHLIEDHAKKVDIPLRFAASKIIEGDNLILDRLDLDDNEKEMIEHIVLQMEKKSVDSIIVRPLRICVFPLLKRFVNKP